MAWRVTADPDRFEEALEWFLNRFPLTEEVLAELGEYAGARAWTVAGVAQLDIVLALFESIGTALDQTQSLEEWKRAAKPLLVQAWGDVSSSRLEVIFRTNIQKAYNRGRWVQMQQVRSMRPYWMFDAIMDSRTTPICQARHHTLLPEDHPWWGTNYPPLHHQCRSSVRAMTPEQAQARGIDAAPPIDATDPSSGFGKTPTADEWRPDPNDYPQDLWDIFEQKQAKSE